MKSSADKTWQIELQCPQCGAPVTLEEIDRILLCDYCRVKLGLVPRDHFRYHLAPPGFDASQPDILYVPYWRVKGIAFACIDRDIEQRVVDASILAGNAPFSPATLGVRAQAVKLRMVSPETAGRFLKVGFPLETFVSRVMERMHNPVADVVGGGDSGPEHSAGTVHYRAFIGETVSLIYSPVTVRDGIAVDALIERPLGNAPDGLLDDPARFESQSLWNIDFIPILCPHCGWDLEGEKDAQVLLCRNCQSAWHSSRGGLKRLEVAVLGTRERNPLYFPFWRVEARIEGLELRTYADLVRLANLPKAVRQEWRERELYHWLPAFKVPSTQILKLSRLVTIFQPSEDRFEKDPPGGECYPVTLPISQAAKGLKMAIASMAVPRNRVYPRLPEVKIRISGYLLVYIPFIQRGGEFVQPDMRMSISRSSMHYGKLL